MNNVIERILGTVAMEPKGQYSSEVYYEKLNTVLYNDSTYIALKSSTGVLPTNTEYWQLIGGGVTKEYVQGQVVDNLNSNETTKSLSAKQGNNLNKSKVEVFDTVADMKLADLKDGMSVQTLGYYEINDGGGATYKITSEESQTDFQEELDNELYATLIVDENTNVKHFGAKGNDSHNDTNSFIKYINYCNKNNKNIKIPIGKYRIYEDLPSLKRTVCINGEVGNNAVQRDSYNKSLILDYRDSENYLINYTSSGAFGNSITNISFTNRTENQLKCINFNHGGYKSELKNIAFANYQQALYIENTHATRLDNVNCILCGSMEDNSNIYAIEITNATDVVMQHCMIEHSRFMVYTHNNANAFLMTDCYFEIASKMGIKGMSPVYVTTGKVINNQFTTRPIKTIADAINDEVNNVYYFVTTKYASFINNSFGVGAANDGTTDSNKKQGKYLRIEGTLNCDITNNRFTYCSYETPSITSLNHGIVFSNNLISVLMEETPTSNYASYFIIENRYSKLNGNNNNYSVLSTKTSSGNLDFLPRLAYYFVKDFYTLDSFYNIDSSFDNYTYNYKTENYQNYPTMIIENLERGVIELQIDSNTMDSGLLYRGIISFNITTSYFSVISEIYKRLSGVTINFIADNDRLLIQLVNQNNKSLNFKINSLTRDGFVYISKNNEQITENIIGSITAS